MEDLRSFSIGSVAGMIGKVVEMPFDTVKVRLQTQTQLATLGPLTAGDAVFTGSIDCLQKTMRQEGVASLYRGIASPLLGSALEAAILFSVYGRVKQFLISHQSKDATSTSPTKMTHLPIWQIGAAGAVTGLLTGVVLTPIELIKCRLQVQRKSDRNGGVYYSGALNCLSHTLKTDGISGLFRGTLSTILREIPGTAVWFASYEGVCNALVDMATPKPSADHQPSAPVVHRAPAGPIIQIIGGACAGCLYWLVPYPFDTVKTRVQTQMHPASQWDVFKLILKEEGIRGLYKGVGFTMVRAVPSSAAVFLTYEQVTAMLRAN